jgi:glutaredoxin/uncharacterized membrane protein YphA (DoxX/SURF4 family)
MNMHAQKTAVLYRMVTPEHICPFGVKSKHLLEKHGFEVEDHHLKDREQTDAFQKEHQVKTTPQTFIDGERVGGLDELHDYLEEPSMKQEGTTYQPVIAIFSTSFLMALAIAYAANSFSVTRVIELFVATSMAVLAIMKLRDLFSFTNQFVTYDLLARRYVPYGYFYPFAEATAGILMLAGALIWIAAPLALFIGTVGAISVFKAVYIDKRELKCACVGGDSNVPLGAISLTENLMMVGMAIWMVGSRMI